MFVDNLDDYEEPHQPLNPIETGEFGVVSDRLFTFITQKPRGRPEKISYSLNEDGERQACYVLSHLDISDLFIFPKLTITQKAILGNGNSLLMSNAEILVISPDEYQFGTLNNNSDGSSNYLSTFWIEDQVGFHPVSMSTEFSLEGQNYRLNFNNQGNLLQIISDSVAMPNYRNQSRFSKPRTMIYTDQNDLRLIARNLSALLRESGIPSNYEHFSLKRVDIAFTNLLASIGAGYKFTSDGDIIPILRYR